MYEGFCGERKHTPKKMCNVDAEYPCAHSYSTIIFIGKLPLGTQPDTFFDSQYKKFSLQFIGTSCSWIWGCMLGSMQRTDKCFRL